MIQKSYSLAFTLLIAFSLGSSPAIGENQWKTGWDEALKAASTRNTLVMADLYTDWCKWCKVLDAQTFGDARVQKELAQLVLVKINAEKGEGVELRKRFKVRGFPAVIFVDAEGQEVDRVAGFVKPEPFLERLAEIRAGTNTFGGLRARAKAQPDDVDVAKLLADKYLERGEFPEAMRLYDEILAKDPEDRSGHAAQVYLTRAKAQLSSRNEQGAIQSLDKVLSLHDPNAIREAYPALRRLHLIAQREEEVDRLHDRVTEILGADAYVLNDIAWFYASRSARLDDALGWARRSVELAPEDPTVLDTLAEVHHRRGEHALAVQAIEKAVRFDPTSDYFQKQLVRFKTAAANASET